ncbi:hypothetical protein NE236_41940 [Actinoallomurus purpureus]|uniref:hypothetical protein n=1 Tax=Actinoallomurus purpureus TaxID=478114 RepID=UPI0020937BEF|nr:hypothetical protein [Actinoallomurus purpureus]MCO6011533.1 hypothetical protein [Actinoallomurus purpureus]
MTPAARSAALAAASHTIRHGGGPDMLRDLLYALGILSDPDAARNHELATIANSRPLVDDQLRADVRDMLLAGRTPKQIAVAIGRSLQVTNRILTDAFTAPSGYIADPAARAAWMLTNAPDYITTTTITTQAA